MRRKTPSHKMLGHDMQEKCNSREFITSVNSQPELVTKGLKKRTADMASYNYPFISSEKHHI